MESVYIVDSNFFIQAHRDIYPLDVAFSFWNKVKALAIKGHLISIDKVKGEIYENDDALKEWCKKNLPTDFFKNTTEVLTEYQRVVTWASSRSSQYTNKALYEFLDADEADAFLVAYALIDNSSRIIVTQEVSRPEQKNKIKIPEPCQFFNIRYIRAMEMFRELGESF